MKQTQSPTIHEVLSTRLPRQTWLSPDGHWVAHSEFTADWEQNSWQHIIVVTDLVNHKQTCRIAERVLPQIKWSWDSKFIGYISVHEGQSVLRRVNCEDGSVEDIVSSMGGFTAFDWHPSSSRLIVAENAPPQEEFDNELFSVQGELTPSPSLLIIDTESGESQRFGGWDQAYFISSLSWSPLGEKVLFTALPEPDNRSQCQHLLTLDPATGQFIRLIEGTRAVFCPLWNEDGSRIAFFDRRQRWDDMHGAALKVLRMSDRSERILLPHLETKSRILSWNKDRILVSGQIMDRSPDVYAVSADSGECAKATIGNMPERSEASASKAGRSIAYISHEEDRFPEVMLESEAASGPIRITDYHSQVQSWSKLNQQRVIWQSADGQDIEGVLIDARDNSKTDKHPLIVLILGGPTINVSNAFFHTWLELWSPYPIRQWVELGISVFMPDYHGSSGYGIEFKDAIFNRLGELEQDDTLRGLDYLLTEYGFDPDRIGVTGISYGGFLTMLLAAKHPSRFAAASTCNGWANLRVQLYGASGNLESYAREDAWDPTKPMGCVSALSYISADCPPMLLQVGERDGIVPPLQSMAFYRLLKKRGGNVKLVTYKDSGHWINHPKQMLAAQEHNLEWFARWLLPEEG